MAFRKAYRGAFRKAFVGQLGANLKPSPLEMQLSPTGNETGVSTIKFTSSSNVQLLLSDGSKFYDDEAGTINEGTERDLINGSERTFYLKCTGTATLTISDVTKITAFGYTTGNGWISGTNAASLSADLGKFVNAEHIHTLGNNTFYGNISNCIKLKQFGLIGGATVVCDISLLLSIEYFHLFSSGSSVTGDVTDLAYIYDLSVTGATNTTSGIVDSLPLVIFNMTGPSASGSTVSGDIGNKINLSEFRSNTSGIFYGDITNNIKLKYLDIYSSACTISGSIDGFTLLETLIVKGTNTITGDISGLSNLEYISADGDNTIYGSISLLTNVTYLVIRGNNTVSGNVTNLIATYIYISGNSQINTYSQKTFPVNMDSFVFIQASGYGFNELEVSQAIKDLSETTFTGNKNIYLSSPNASMSDTSQGGIWGDFSGSAIPSDLSIALKLLQITKTVSVSLNGVSFPSATGDGNGFPLNFGDWWRS